MLPIAPPLVGWFQLNRRSLPFREDPTLLKERDAYTALSRVVVEVAAAKHPERDYSHIAKILRAAR